MMMASIWCQNLLAHWLQAALIASGACAFALLLRPRHPGVRLLFWQAALALVLVVPFVPPLGISLGDIAPDFRGVSVVIAGARVDGGSAGAVNWPYAILLAIAIGAVSRLAWLAVGVTRLRHLRRKTRVLPLVPEVDVAARELGVTTAVRISDDDGPVNFGLVDTIVVLPASFLDLDSDDRRAVALHELAHVRRHDWLAALVEETACAFLWFHPWVWSIRREIRLAREEVVDREVVERTGAREQYARCLLAMAGYDAAAFPPAIGLLRARELHHRLDALFQEVDMSRPRLVFTVAVMIAALSSLATFAATAFPLSQSATEAGQSTSLVFKIGDGVSAPLVVHEVKPRYTPSAMRAKIQGNVTLECVVLPDGTVGDTRVVRSLHPELDREAIKAVTQWRFKPGVKDGKPVAVQVSIEMAFTLSTKRPPVYKPGNGVSLPKAIKEAKAVYTAEALAAKTQGTVWLECVVLPDGSVGETRVTRSLDPGLDQEAINAVKQWRFEPGTRNGQPVPVQVTIEMTFTLR